MYPPETANTAKFLHGITEAIAAQHDVHVLSAQPTYDQRGVTAPRRERAGATMIERLPSTTFDRHRLALRLVNAATLLVSFAFYGFRRLRDADVVLVVTNPPFLPLLVVLLAKLRRVPCVVLVHDVYPHALVGAGLTRRGSVMWRLLHPVFAFGFRAADGVVALADDMHRLLVAEFGVAEERITVIPNWGDEDEVFPDRVSGAEMRERLGLSNRFIVQVMGNMGRTHGLDVVLDAAAQLQDSPTVQFLLVGGGKQADRVREEIARRTLTNVTLIPPCSRADLRGMLNAADVAVITFRPGMAGVSAPSRIYNCLAAGQPLLTVADANSDPAHIVRDNGCGVALDAGDSVGLASAIRRLQLNGDALQDMRHGGRALFLARFRYAEIAETWRRYFADLFARCAHVPTTGV